MIETQQISPEVAPEQGWEPEPPAADQSTGTGKRRRLFLIAGIVLLLILAVATYWSLGKSNLEYRTAEVRTGNIESIVSATGIPNAVVTVQVGSQVSGNVSALYADFNTTVKKDQLVARIDPQLFQAQVNL